MPIPDLPRCSATHRRKLQSSIFLTGMLSLLRRNPETQAIPVVVLSAEARWIDSQILRQYQIAGIILKPFDPVTLPIQIMKMLDWDSMPICDQ